MLEIMKRESLEVPERNGELVEALYQDDRSGHG
jgi:hypothetical protein